MNKCCVLLLFLLTCSACGRQELTRLPDPIVGFEEAPRDFFYQGQDETHDYWLQITYLCSCGTRREVVAYKTKIGIYDGPVYPKTLDQGLWFAYDLETKMITKRAYRRNNGRRRASIMEDQSTIDIEFLSVIP